jgi:hypothetical protein
MPHLRIPPADWVSFLDNFSRSHAGWLTSLEVVSEKAPALLEARKLPLEGIVADRKGSGEPRISILLGWEGRTRITHAVLAPTVLRFDQTAEGADSGLEFVAGDGTKTILRFAAPARPELVDGLPGQPRGRRRR